MEILTYPNKLLRTKCERVRFDGDERFLDTIFRDLRTALGDKGIGLAANQIGVLKQVFIMRTENSVWRAVINPEILTRSHELAVYIEGCLSFPGRKVRTRRPKEIAVRYCNRKGELVNMEFSGLEADCFQHEFDHLQGKTMLDREFNGRICK